MTKSTVFVCDFFGVSSWSKAMRVANCIKNKAHHNKDYILLKLLIKFGDNYGFHQSRIQNPSTGKDANSFRPVPGEKLYVRWRPSEEILIESIQSNRFPQGRLVSVWENSEKVFHQKLNITSFGNVNVTESKIFSPGTLTKWILEYT